MTKIKNSTPKREANTNQYKAGKVVLDEYLKDANIPPPISIAKANPELNDLNREVDKRKQGGKLHES